jgi:two-component system, cell cycle sensor histidine kinase and response regulator CckA
MYAQKNDLLDEVFAPISDPQRLSTLRETQLLDTPPEEVFDRFTRLASRMIGAPIALISLVDKDRQFFKSAVGLGEPLATDRETPLSVSFCKYLVATGEPLLIEDARSHPLVCDNPAVTEGGVVAYAGVPLQSSGQTLGSFCVVDYQPRNWSEEQIETLQTLAASVMTEIELRRLVGKTRQVMRDRIAEKDERFRIIIESVRDYAIYMTDTDGHVSSWNAGAEHLLGYSQEEVLGRMKHLFFTEEDVRERRPEWEFSQAIEHGSHDDEGWRVRKDGTRFWASVLTTVINGSNGEVRGFVKVLRDITEQREAERERKALAERYRATFEDAPVGIANVDLEGLWLDVNPKFSEILGYTREELLGQRAMEILPPEDESVRVKLFQIRDQLLRREIQSYTFEKRCTHKEGKPIWVNFTITVACEDGSPSYFITVLEDITDQKMLEEQFRQSQKLEALGLLAGGVAHDFNNMMSVVIGYSSLLLSKPSVDPQCLKGLEMIKQAGEHAAGLTRQLLAFSRKQALSPEMIDLNGVIGHSHKMLRRLITEDIELVTLPSPEPLPLFADPGQIEQVLINLVVNARDAMPQGGQLTVQSQRVHLSEEYAQLHSQTPPGVYALLSVSDTGVGMDKETQRRVFEPFFTTKEKGKGTGLGLSTVYGIVKQSGGQIELYSESGQGTVFKIYLPLIDQDLSAGPSEKVPQEDHRGGATVLVVEDEPMVRSLVSASLQSHGYAVLEAGNGEEGLRLYERHLRHEGGIDLVLTDTIMPQMGGRELAERIKVVHPEQKVLFMSGYTDDTIIRHGVLEAGIHFLQKPFTPQVLLDKVKGLLQETEVRS